MSPPFWERSQGSNVFCWSLCALFFIFLFFPGLWFHADQFTLLPGGSRGRFASQGRTQALGISLFEALFFLVFVSL